MINENLHDLKIHLESSLKTSLPAGPETAMQAKALPPTLTTLVLSPDPCGKGKKGFSVVLRSPHV